MSEIERKSTRLVRQASDSAAPLSGVASVSDTDLRRASSGGTATFPSSSTSSETRGGFWPYLRIARVDHWFKNAFMALGTLLALFYHPDLFTWNSALPLVLATAATCLVASSNYVLNEILDGPTDRLHPTKRNRPVPSGQVNIPVAYAEWL